MKAWIWGRLACLGKETLAHLGLEASVVNHQKARADYVVDAYLDPGSRVRPGELAPELFVRKDVLDLQSELADLGFAGEPPLAIFLDSFSELTDQRFYHREHGWSFCSHYSDVDGNDLKEFVSTGLLPMELIPGSIFSMIRVLRSFWPESPIFYIHFPTDLDARPQYRERAETIRGALERIRTRVDGVFSIEAHPLLVAADPDAPPELVGFPYHFHRDVSLDLAAKIAELVEASQANPRDRIPTARASEQPVPTGIPTRLREEPERTAPCQSAMMSNSGAEW